MAILAACGIVMQLWLGEDRHIAVMETAGAQLAAGAAGDGLYRRPGGLLRDNFVVARRLRKRCVFFRLDRASHDGTGEQEFLPTTLAGISTVMNSMLAAANTTQKSFSFSLDVGSRGLAQSAFVWNGIEWTGPIVFSRLAWSRPCDSLNRGFRVLFFFDRFDTARAKVPRGGMAQAHLEIATDAVA